jgi:hypothetical protein
MGTSSSAAELVGKITKASVDLQKSQGRTVGAAAAESKRIIESAMGVATGDRRLSGRRNARIGVRYKVFEGGTRTVANVRAYGPAHLVERPTSAHVIRPRRKRAIVIPGVGPRMVAHHPGARGKFPFRTGTTAAIPRVNRIVRTGTFNAGLGAFR